MDIQTGFTIFFGVVALILGVFAIAAETAPSKIYFADAQHEGKLFWWWGVVSAVFIAGVIWLGGRIFEPNPVTIFASICAYGIIPCVFAVVYNKQKTNRGRVLACDVANVKSTIRDYYVAIVILTIVSVVCFSI